MRAGTLTLGVPWIGDSGWGWGSCVLLVRNSPDSPDTLSPVGHKVWPVGTDEEKVGLLAWLTLEVEEMEEEVLSLRRGLARCCWLWLRSRDTLRNVGASC